MNIWEKNCEALAKRDIRLEKMIKQYTANSENVSSQTAKDGGLYQIFHNVRLNSAYSPMNEAICWGLRYKNISDDTVFLVHGLGNGIFIRELIKQKQGQRDVLVYEPFPEIFYDTMKNYDITDIINNPHCKIIVKDMNEFTLAAEIMNLITRFYKCNTNLTSLPQYSKIDSEGINYLEDIWREENDLLQINKNTNKRFSQSDYHNQLYHFKYLRNQYLITNLADVWDKKMPMVIVGAGPSLDKNIEELKRLKGHVPILCMDSALITLEQHGLIPDFYMSIEAKKPLELFHKDWLEGIPYLGGLASTTELVDSNEFIGPKIFCKDTPFIEMVYKKMGLRIPTWQSGGNVGTAAFTASVEVGAKTLILVGHDHAFSESGEAHTDGRIEKYRESFWKDENNMVEGVNGRMIQSRCDWKLYLQWYVRSIPYLDDVEVINATEGGARIQGTKEMKLSDVVKQYQDCEFSIEEIMGAMESPFDDDMMVRIHEYTEEMERQRKSLLYQAEKAEELARQLLRELSLNQAITTKSIKMSQDLLKLNEEMMKKEIYKFIDECREAIEKDVELGQYHSDNSEVQEYLNMYEEAYHQYEGLVAAAKFLKER